MSYNIGNIIKYNINKYLKCIGIGIKKKEKMTITPYLSFSNAMELSNLKSSSLYIKTYL